MEKGKFLYKFLLFVTLALVVYNLFTGGLLLLMIAFSPPRMAIALTLIGPILFIPIYIKLKNKIGISYYKKSAIISVSLFFLLLPFIYGLFQEPLVKYVYEWEQEHCQPTGGFSGQVPEYGCDNGDLIYKTDFKEDDRLYEKGKNSAHFPYWLIY